jgi:hypothetical protein
MRGRWLQAQQLEVMRNIFAYYSVIILPFAALIYLSSVNYIPTWWAIGLILAYAVVYRPIIDYLRLKSKGVITKKDFWKAFNPFFQSKYFRALYLP